MTLAVIRSIGAPRRLAFSIVVNVPRGDGSHVRLDFGAMPMISRTEVVSALAQSRPDDLKGTAENGWLDFKTTPYAVHTEKGKFELAKDVAAFANAQGGLLVCGARTVALTTEAKDVVEELTPFPKELAKIQNCRDVIQEYVLPPVTTNFTWYDAPAKEGCGYLIIEVEPLHEQARYAMVRKMLSDKDKFTEGWSIPVRHGDQTVFLHPNEIYYLINTTQQSRTGARAAPVAIASTTPTLSPADLAAGRRELEELLDWQDTPVLYWQSTPSRVPDGFLEQLHRPDGIRHHLINQESLRGEQGFNFMFAYVPPKAYEGGLLLSDSRRALWVRADGSVIAGAVATGDLLCWAMNQQGDSARLNVIALSEANLEYFRWVDRFLLPVVDGQWEHRVTAKRFTGEEPRLLAPGANPVFPMIGMQNQASSADWDRAWLAAGDPEVDAFQALSQIYALFGLAASQNPFTTDGRVDTEKVREATRRS
ncbi:helix-turn-helix domain-containing protein [Streptomyces sp. NPDC090493]|uniref:AlbA family DNA-binding domain-containing protein n=1 Tax=Streptomyces sp. NPDC090493 TaxID=3365964 RepID=UPI00382FF1FE